MSLSIEIPMSFTPHTVDGDKIEVMGAAEWDGEAAIKLFGRIYTSNDPAPNPIPAEPPENDPKVTVHNHPGLQWQFTVGNAICSDTEPHPENVLVVWAQQINGEYENFSVGFFGQCAQM